MDGICVNPFSFIEILPNGNVTPCCSSYCRYYSFGNLFHNNLEEIWRSDKAREFRDKLLHMDYSLCDLKLCRGYSKKDYNTIKKDYYISDMVNMPTSLSVSYDINCNMSCNFCTPRKRNNDKSDQQRMLNIENNYFRYLKYMKSVSLSGGGDPFGSTYALNLIRRIRNNFPHIKFSFLTNGLLLSPNMYFKLDLSGSVTTLSVSLHAASENTYKLVTNSVHFNKIIEHLQFYSWLKSKGEIQNLNIYFVVCTENYKDMLKVAKLAEDIGAKISFTQYRKLGSEKYSTNYIDHAPFLKDNPHYNNFIQCICEPYLRSKHCKFDGYLQSLIDKNM